MAAAVASAVTVASTFAFRVQRAGTTPHTEVVRFVSTCQRSSTKQKAHRFTGDPGTKEAFASLGLRELDIVFNDPAAPLIVDVGCGYGRFLLQMAREYPHFNCLGLEIREPTVDRAKRWAQALNMQDRMEFVVANATLSMKSMLQSYPGKIVLVSVQFPDPHFKRKHQKRHTVQPQFCSEVADVLCPGGTTVWYAMPCLIGSRPMRVPWGDLSLALLFSETSSIDSAETTTVLKSLVFVQSDVRGVLHYMLDTFQQAEPQRLQQSTDVADVDLRDPELLLRPRAHCGSGSIGQGEWSDTAHNKYTSSSTDRGLLESNPLGFPTEREVHSKDKGKAVYRFMLQKQC